MRAANEPSILDLCKRAGVHLTPERKRIAVLFDIGDAELTLNLIRAHLQIERLRIPKSTIERFLDELFAKGVLRCVGVSEKEKVYARQDLTPEFDLLLGEARAAKRLWDANLAAAVDKALSRHGVRRCGRVSIQVTEAEETP